MKTGLKNIRLISPGHELDGQQIDMVIGNGKILSVNHGIELADEVIDIPGLCVSAGWVDLRATTGEPGFEHRENLLTVANAAARGGFTQVAILPAKAPVTQSRGALDFVRSQGKNLPVQLLPMAALTVDLGGNDLTEITDLHHGGAIAFTDGTRALSRADVLVKALEYVKPLNGLVIQRPEQKDLASGGVMHEGIRSTMLGLKGVPAVAEEVMLERDLQLLRYTGGKIHFSLISTRRAVSLIKEARRDGLNVTCDIAAHQLAFTDESMAAFDTNYKVSPPFRSESDLEALKSGLADSTIDAIVSDHRPYDVEGKELEFDLAEFGITGLETAFAVANTFMAKEMALEVLLKKFTDGPRKILCLEQPLLEEGAQANLTLFDPEKEWVFEQNQTESKSYNSPFYGVTLKGKVFATCINGQFTKNRYW